MIDKIRRKINAVVKKMFLKKIFSRKATLKKHRSRFKMTNSNLLAQNKRKVFV